MLDLYYCKSLLENFSEKNFLDDSFLVDKGLQVYQYIKDFYRKFGKAPSEETIKNDLDVELPETHENTEYYISKLRERKKTLTAIEVTKKLERHVKNDLINEWFTEIKQTSRQWYDILEERKAVTTLKDLAPDILEYFEFLEQSKHGDVIGVPSLWPQLDKHTLGWQPGDLITVVGKLGVGKSFFALLLAKKCYECGKRILFITMEMTKVKIGLRFIAISQNISWDKVRRGLISQEDYQRVFNLINNDEQFLLVDSSAVKNDIDVELLIEEYKPDIVFIDGVYLISGREWEKINDLVRNLKLIAIRHKVPIIQTTQFNRQVRASALSADTDKIGFSNAIGEDSDVCIGLLRNSRLISREMMKVQILKLREAFMPSFMIQWDLDGMKFDFIEYEDYEKEQSDDPERMKEKWNAPSF